MSTVGSCEKQPVADMRQAGETVLHDENRCLMTPDTRVLWSRSRCVIRSELCSIPVVGSVFVGCVGRGSGYEEIKEPAQMFGLLSDNLPWKDVSTPVSSLSICRLVPRNFPN